MPIHPIARAAFGAVCLSASALALADTTTYTFAGNYYNSGGSQGYSGSFSIVDPTPTAPRPWKAPDVTHPDYATIWTGTSEFYTGGRDLTITFASGTTLTAASIEIVVNNTTFQGTGSPYPEGLSVQLYPSALTITPPTGDVCATVSGVCGEDDDPLYHDDTQASILQITDSYFAFYNAPLASTPGMPDLLQFGGGGLGVIAGPTTTLTAFNMLTATVTPSALPPIPAVPEPGTWAMMLAGLAAVGTLVRRSRPRG
jgi:PEP-CTERM motif